MKKILLSFLLLTTGMSLGAQEYSGLWRKASTAYISERGLPALKPERFAAFTVAETSLEHYLATAPQDPAAARIIDLPTPEGGYRSFRIWSTPAMEKELAIKYPGIATYTAEAVDNRRVTAKLDYTPFGFHAMVFDGAQTYLIDPYSGSADGAYIVYYKKDYSRPVGQRMSCGVGEDEALHAGELSLTQNGLPDMQRLNGTTRRTYRLALACNGEYAVAVAGASPTKAAVLAKMVTSVNRINGVYEREIAVTMVLVTKEDTLIFLNAATDPYSNNSSASTMLSENQPLTTTRIGSTNYDIGHVFSTGAGGQATQGCVCQTNSKARGVTGNANPIGDAFDIDYVAHEMGHQFGAGHTFNANTGSCNGNGVQTIAYEPGAGSTIMAYAGICGGGNDYQAHSDAYFHSASLEQISTFINANGGTCATTVTSTNTNATIGAFTATYTIPYLTPFELTAPAASDVTADTLTYCWEQRDLGDFRTSFAQTRFAGPIFRSFSPDTSRTRVFPELAKLVNGFAPIGEKLPDTARTMHFRMTERDIYQGWGTFNFPDDIITLSVAATIRPFTVTTPSGGEDWAGKSTQTVTWDVAGTTAAPVSCATVDIYLSADGGYTFPYLVKAGTPNDGSELIVVPNVGNTSTARIKVKGSGNVFFNISGADFTVVHNSVGVSQAPLMGEVAISPVPARDLLNIDVPAALGAMLVRVINAVGQAVWSGTISGHTILPVADWARGIYQVQMQQENGARLTRKIVVE